MILGILVGERTLHIVKDWSTRQATIEFVQKLFPESSSDLNRWDTPYVSKLPSSERGQERFAD